jgi:hypothetical protein
MTQIATNLSRLKKPDAVLIQYFDIGKWRPSVGDVIMKHGKFFQRVKWFGVVNHIDQDGKVFIIKDGLISLLVTQNGQEQSKNTICLNHSEIVGAVKGSYSIVKQEAGSAAPIWYL